MRLLSVVALLSLIWPHQATAQQPAAPEPILTVTIDPPHVVVGQRATLRIDVLAPNYMTSPPELPDFQLRNAVTRQLQSVNLSEERNGTAYAGVRFEFAIYPQEPGSYAIVDSKLKVKYAAEPPAVREETLSLPRVGLYAFIPDVAAGLAPFLAASGLTIEQSLNRSSEQLQVGDSVTRTITVRAEETPSMMLPPATFPPMDGFAVYPAQPALQDKTEGRSDALTATRTDSATYILQQPGDFMLPPIDIRWWNVGEARIDTAHLDGVTLNVAANPVLKAGEAGLPAGRSTGATIAGIVGDHWLGIVVILAALVALAWMGPRVVRAIMIRHRQRHAAYLQSEQFAFDKLRQATLSGDAKASYFALLNWLDRLAPARPAHSLSAAAADPVLESEVAELEARLFAGEPAGANWSAQKFIRHISSARRVLRKVSDRSAKQAALPPVNPTGDRIPPRHQWRKIAR